MTEVRLLTTRRPECVTRLRCVARSICLRLACCHNCMQSVAKVNATKPKNTNKNAEQPQEGWQVLLQCNWAIRKTLCLLKTVRPRKGNCNTVFIQITLHTEVQCVWQIIQDLLSIKSPPASLENYEWKVKNPGTYATFFSSSSTQLHTWPQND